MLMLEIIEGDVTTLEVDAIVNAANSRLQHGGGVAGAIVRGGGAVIQRESDAIGYVPVGAAAVTSAGNLPCRYVIHAVGPMWGEGDEEAKLAGAVRSALERAAELNVDSVAIPAISAGIFGFPLRRCAEILLREAVAFANTHDRPRRIIFCLFGKEAFDIFRTVYDGMKHGR